MDSAPATTSHFLQKPNWLTAILTGMKTWAYQALNKVEYHLMTGNPGWIVHKEDSHNSTIEF